VGQISRRLVSVVLPCYNAARFLREALDSVRAQSHRELEVIAVDDGSDDATLQILRETASDDPRIRVLANGGQRGIIHTLNRAVDEAGGEFIARMDADDVVARDRIARQLEVLESRPEIGVVGSAALVTDEDGLVIGRLPVRCTRPSAVAFLALFAAPLMHPTILARASVTRKFPYRQAKECLHVEDYDLLTRMLADGVPLANIDAALYMKRSHPGGVSRKFEQTQIENFVRLGSRHLERTVGVRLSREVYRVVSNRMDSTTTADVLRQGLLSLDRLQRLYLDGLRTADPGTRGEVIAVAGQQRVDILGQAVLKGRSARRLAAIPLVARYAPATLANASLRRYLREKLAGRVLPAGDRHG
jgi:glycosyltransferase involved in cell wall biosynthesis